MKRPLVVAAIFAAFLQSTAVARANVATDWNRTMIGALETSHIPPPPAMRAGAIVQASVFDALNGIERRYTPIHVQPAAPPGASRAAAVAGAAYEALVGLFPAQKASFDLQLQASLAQITDNPDNQSVARGLAWGESVADQILAWRATDGFTAVLPPYVASGLPGRWAPTPPLFGPPALPAVRDGDPVGDDVARAVSAASAARAVERPVRTRPERGGEARKFRKHRSHGVADRDRGLLAERHARRHLGQGGRRPDRRK